MTHTLRGPDVARLLVQTRRAEEYVQRILDKARKDGLEVEGDCIFPKEDRT